MAIYTVKIRSGEVLTIGDRRDLASLSKALHDDGLLDIASSVSAHNAGELERILLMKQAAEYFKMKEATSAADRPHSENSPADIRAMITQLAEAVTRPSAFRPNVPN